MTQIDTDEIESFLASELLQLNFKTLIIRKACKKFSLTKEESTDYYRQVKSKIRKAALNRALVYLLLGSIFLFVGISGTFGETGFIVYSKLLLGIGMTVSSLGFFKIYLTS